MKGEGKPEHILIRCKGCGENACTVSCKDNAVVYIGGDLLIEATKCVTCKQEGFPIPACIRECQNSGDKLVLDMVSIEEKRKAGADIMPLLRV